MMTQNEPRMIDREAMVGIAVCILLLIGWQVYVWKTQPAPKPPAPVAATVPTVSPSDSGEGAEKTFAPAATDLPVAPESVAAPLPPSQAEALPEMPPVQLENELCRVTVDLQRGCIDGVVLKHHLKADMSAPVVLGEASAEGNGPLAIVGKEPWQVLSREIVAQDGRRVSLRRELARSSDHARFRLKQTWELSEDYRVRYEVALENLGSGMLSFPELWVDAGGIGPISLVAGDKVFRELQSSVYCLRDTAKDHVSYREVARPGFMASWFGSAEAKVPKGFSEFQENPVRWIGAVNKYFACLLIPDDGFPAGNRLSAEPLPTHPETKPQEAPFRMGAAGLEKDLAIAPGAAWNGAYTWYAGPQEIARLRELSPTVPQVMRLSWWWMSWISRQLAVALIWLKAWCGSYGLAIILLTVIVKVAFWPATHRANLSMRKMQAIQPMIKELRSKYAKDQQRLSAETMKLYREHGVNPFGGCLPILLQMPVFFALYGTLTGAIELRHAGFLWIRDLTLPDTVGHLPLGFADVPINPLMLAWGASMLLQQKLTPSAADPAQQKMMMFMPLVMTVMFYNAFPGGLTLYWTVSQAIGIAQLLHQQRRPDHEPAPSGKAPTGKTRAAST